MNPHQPDSAAPTSRATARGSSVQHWLKRDHFPGVPPEEAVHLWALSTETPPVPPQQLWPLLSAEEQQRAARYRFDSDRCAFVLRRGVLRLLVGRYLRRRPEHIVFAYGAHGKPALCAAQRTDLRFNLSCTDDLVLYAFASSAPLGVDVERVQPIADLGRVAGACLLFMRACGLFSPAGCRTASGFFEQVDPERSVRQGRRGGTVSAARRLRRDTHPRATRYTARCTRRRLRCRLVAANAPSDAPSRSCSCGSGKTEARAPFRLSHHGQGRGDERAEAVHTRARFESGSRRTFAPSIFNSLFRSLR